MDARKPRPTWRLLSGSTQVGSRWIESDHVTLQVLARRNNVQHQAENLVLWLNRIAQDGQIPRPDDDGAA